MVGEEIIGSRPSARLVLPRLVGREQELERLVEVLTSPPSVAIIRGEAGVGKTALVRALASDPALAGRRMLLAEAQPLTEPFPFGPLIEALRAIEQEWPGQGLSRVVGALRPLLPELADQLPPRPERLGDVRAERHRVFRGLRELFAELGPTVCVLEDLQWADDRTLEFIPFLLAQPPVGLSLIITYRDEEVVASSLLKIIATRIGPSASRAVIELSPLPPEETGRFASIALDVEEVSPGLARALHEQTGGVPFALEDVVRALADAGGREPLEEALDRLDVPLATRDWTLERAGRLERDARLVLRAAAVLATRAPETLLSRVAGLPPVRCRKGLAEALRAGLLEYHDQDLYGFRLKLAGRAIYEEIPSPERRRLHLRAARALESPHPLCPPVQLAHHFERAGHERKRAQYLEAAADAAASAEDRRSAARLLERALSSDGLTRDATIRVALKLGEAALAGSGGGTCVPALERLLSNRALPMWLRGQLRFSLARIRWQYGDASSLEREMARAVHELRRRPAIAARALVVRAAAEPLIQGSGDEPFSWLDRALDLAAREADPALTTFIKNALAYVLLYRGDPTGWNAVEDLPWHPTGSEHRLELARSCLTFAQAAVRLGHYRRGEALLDDAERIGEDLDPGLCAAPMANCRAWLQWRKGCWQGLESRTRSLIASSGEALSGRACNDMILGSLLLARGELAQAEESFASALDLTRDFEAAAPIATMTAALASVHLARGDAGTACKLAVKAVARISERNLWAGAPSVAPVAVDALLACGNRLEAENVTRSLAHGLRGRDAPAAYAALAFCRGSVAEAAARRRVAIRWFAQAERGWSGLPAAYEAALARERLGRCLVEEESERGPTTLIAALSEFETLGAPRDAARVRAALRRAGVTLEYPWRGGRKRYGDKLSPREAEVARAAAMGWTNREIGASLFLSPRTVEKHVASALSKLGLASRAELAARTDSLN